MKKGKYASILTYNPSKAVRYEHIKGRSMAVADETFSIREILQRSAKGLRSTTGATGTYQESENFDSVDMQKLGHQDLFLQEQELERARRVIAAAQEGETKKVESSSTADGEAERSKDAQESDETESKPSSDESQD